jgi:hypothetical protein
LGWNGGIIPGIKSGVTVNNPVIRLSMEAVAGVADGELVLDVEFCLRPANFSATALAAAFVVSILAIVEKFSSVDEGLIFNF